MLLGSLSGRPVFARQNTFYSEVKPLMSVSMQCCCIRSYVIQSLASSSGIILQSASCMFTFSFGQCRFLHTKPVPCLFKHDALTKPYLKPLKTF